MDIDRKFDLLHFPENIIKMQLGNGRWENYSYNARLQITEIGLGATSAARDVLKLEYKYDSTTTSRDNNGSLREQKITVPGIAEPFVQTYTYDDLNRLKSATETNNSVQTWKQTFDIDRYGNRKFDTQNNNTTTLGDCPTAVCNPTANTSDNRFPTASGYQYDANGNLTENAKEERFVYDTENHQTAFFNESNTGSTPDATYAYDGEGKRVKKVTAAETTVFVYDGAGKLVAEYSTALATTQQVSYLTQDHLGSPRVVTNEDGTVIDRKDYSAFGEESVSAQRNANAEYTAADQLRKNYTGYEKDSESGLEFAQARYYNPTHGRFTSVDPLTASASIRNPQTFNRYSYVQNSPYKFTDPLGLRSIQTDGSGTQTPDLGPWADGWSSDYDSGWTYPWDNNILDGIVAVSAGSNGQLAELSKPDRNALEKSLRKLVPGTRVLKDGRISVPRKLQSTASARLLSGIAASGGRLTIAVNHVGSLETRAVNRDRTVNLGVNIGGGKSDALVYWDPSSRPPTEMRLSANAIETVPATPEITLAHELIHGFNRLRGDSGAWDYGFHFFPGIGYQNLDIVRQSELRALGYGFNAAGDVTVNQIRAQLGIRSRASYNLRNAWIQQCSLNSASSFAC